MTDIQPLITELAKLLVPAIVEHLDINGYKFSDITTDDLHEVLSMADLSEYMSEDVGTMVNNYIGEGYVDDIIEQRIEEVMSNGSFDVEVTYHA
jgi:hypothetical protein|tara:strand:- start:465 stop:746 length:282 start_codon:yes stop_codon:yes gene_type:complete